VCLGNERKDKTVTRLQGQLVDSFGRVARKLRISVTDRCNFRCFFCMPMDPSYLSRDQMLTYEEITRLVTICASLGVAKVRLTGGEPLVRREIEKLVGMIRQVRGIETVHLTTNGFYLAEKASSLRASGLDGVTVSLHSLRPERFNDVVRADGVFDKVLAGIARAREEGLPVKINCVVIRGCNDDELLDFARLAREGNVTVRFIEYMPFDGEHSWDPQKVVSGQEIIRRISAIYPLRECARDAGSTAQLYRFRDGSPGEVGVITSMTKPFCSDCDRIRLKVGGTIVPCMFSPAEYNIMPLLRGGASDDEVRSFLQDVFWKKAPGVHALLQTSALIPHIRPMYTIGG
jgi:cyclic pyranopterin phosphate synthase